MAERREQVEAELENIERVLAELPNCKSLPELSTLELSGVAALIHNFYNGIENILKLIIISYNKELPDGSSWHQDLVSMATENNIISQLTAQELRRYLAFRHFFSHGYSFELDKRRITTLVKDIRAIFSRFRDEVNKSLDKV